MSWREEAHKTPVGFRVSGEWIKQAKALYQSVIIIKVKGRQSVKVVLWLSVEMTLSTIKRYIVQRERESRIYRQRESWYQKSTVFPVCLIYMFSQNTNYFHPLSTSLIIIKSTKRFFSYRNDPSHFEMQSMFLVLNAFLPNIAALLFTVIIWNKWSSKWLSLL